MFLTFIFEFWGVLSEMAPYLLFGFLVAGLLSVLILPRTVERHLGGRGIWPVVKAAVFGIPLPLCSCGVIPVAASLRRHGASRGATTAFLLSTPQTGVDSILVTFSLLGPVFAVFRPLAALLAGLIGGSFVAFMGFDEEAEGDNAEPCTDSCCSGDDRRGLSRALYHGFVTLPRDIGRSLLVGLIIAGAISSLVPDDYFTEILGTGIVVMFIMMMVGIPIYVCATASVPVAAALMAKGISPGAALAFLMTGPATNAATVTTIWKIMGRRTAIAYLGVVASTALGAGVLLDYVFEVRGVSPAPDMPWMLPSFIKIIAAVVLLVVLGVAIFRLSPKRDGTDVSSEGVRKATISISGMKCSHCASSVQRSLGECHGVKSAVVDLEGRRAIVTGDDFDLPSLRRAVEKLGYRADEDQTT